MAVFQKMTEEDLKDVNGGYRSMETIFGGCKYEVLDDKTGEVVATFYNREESEKYCTEWGYNPRILNWNQIQNLRNEGHI